MLIHAFLSGLGIALAYTVITSIIIDSHEVHSLPFLYVVTSILLLLIGFVYSKLEHKYQPAKLFKGVLLALSLWGVFMFLNFRMGRSFLIISIAFCSYYLVYYLSNLEYWGSASLIFDVRQGKRLFGLLSVGESLAKIMGYAMTPVIIHSFSESGVFMVVALSFGGAYLIFLRLSKSYHSSMLVSHSDHHHEHKRSGSVITKLQIAKIFKRDSFKIYISLFALISTLTYFLIHYAFLVKIEERYVDLEDIAVFIATLYSSAKIANLLIKIFLSGRIFQFMGLKVVLLLLPTLLLAVNLYGVVGILTGQIQENFIIWVFTSIIIIDEVFRTSLYTPAYLTLFQPLTKEKRLEGHTLCKGIMEPIGIGIAGILILILIESDLFNLSILSYIILFWLLMWIFSGNKLFKSYLGILQNALKSKLLNRGTLELSKEEVHILINDKLKSQDPLERLYALKMLGNRLPVGIIE
ncbi:MAG: hypothetical protein KJO29_04645, partial [Bacteroidia bacterium]|nr:hypothetical protein [Bacteroidia bacterium]